MDVMTAIQTRRSIRKYQDKEVPKDVLMRLLEAARLAPSGANRQPWELVVVTDLQKRRALVPICKNQKFIEEAAVFIVGIDDPQQKWSRVDLAIALDELSLAAVELGLGTCWIGAFDGEKMASFLQIPKNRVVTVCMTLGYPDETPDARSRKQLDELVDWNVYAGADD